MLQSSELSPAVPRETGEHGLRNRTPLDEAPFVDVGLDIRGRYGLCASDAIIENRNAVKTHPKRQISKLARSLKVSGTLAPLVIDESYTVLAGHARLAAAKLNGSSFIPVLQVFGLSHAQKRQYLLADNEIGRDAGLDRAKIAQQLPELTILFEEAALELTDTGFEIAELDQIVLDAGEDAGNEEELETELFDEPVVLRYGDLLALGEHRLIVGDARDSAVIEALLAGEQADAGFIDPSYVTARSIGGRGRVRHPDFAFASGEMSESEFVAFLEASFRRIKERCRPGAVVFVCMDWKHVRELLEASRAIFDAYLSLVVWNKTNAGQGGLYRNKHELIGVFRVGDVSHRDNVQQGLLGRNRPNVWTYAGVNTFRAGRLEDLAEYSTVKPTAMVVDALRDVTARNELVLDTFVGSGTTILAGEKIGRRVRAVEIDPRYAQVAARRWEKMTGRDAIHVASGKTIEELADRDERRPTASLTPAILGQNVSPVPSPRIRTRLLSSADTARKVLG